MKKHLGIFIVIGLGAAFVIALGLIELNSNDITDEIGGAGGSAEIPEHIKTYEGGDYDLTTYTDLKTKIASFEMAEEITKEQSKYLLSDLSVANTKALVRSFEKWESTSCGRNFASVKNVVNAMKVQQKEMPSDEIKKKLQTYSNYQLFLAYENKVNYFQKGLFSASEADGLRSRINASFNKSGVKNCSAMKTKRASFLKRISVFEGIHKGYEALIRKNSTVVFSEDFCETLAAYPYYKNGALTGGHCF